MTVPFGNGNPPRFLTAEPLSHLHAAHLSIYLRDADREECAALGVNPLVSLCAGIEAGRATAIIDDARGEGLLGGPGRPQVWPCIGAFGWTYSGSIWGLFTDLDRAQSAEILRQTPQWVRGMLRESGCEKLGNVVHWKNRNAIGWLRASECFSFSLKMIRINGATFLPFHTREDLLNV